jgi:hypothetical protein
LDQYGREFFFSQIHLYLLRSGEQLAKAIKKAVSASVNEVTIFNSLPDKYELEKNPSSLLIIPELTRRNAAAWRTHDFPAIFEVQLKLIVIGKYGKIIDSIFINAVGESSVKSDSVAIMDTVIAEAADSGISNMQDQIVCALTQNDAMHKSLSLPNSLHNIAVVVPGIHGLYGTETQFNYDTISHTLIPIPRFSRWSFWEDIGMSFNLSSREYFSIGVDILLHSQLSFRLGLFNSHYFDSHSLTNYGVFAQTSYLFLGRSKTFCRSRIRIA